MYNNLFLFNPTCIINLFLMFHDLSYFSLFWVYVRMVNSFDNYKLYIGSFEKKTKVCLNGTLYLRAEKFKYHTILLRVSVIW